MTWRFNIALIVLALIIGIPAWWLLFDTSPGNVPAKPLAIAELRRLASAIPGQKPTEIEMEVVAWRRLPGAYLVAGAGIKRRLVAEIAFRLEVPGKGPVMIDTGSTAALARAAGMEGFDRVAQARLDAMMREASLILVTDEDGDHLGGLAALSSWPDAADILPRAKLAPPQLPVAAQPYALPWRSGLTLQPGLTGTGPEAASPGIVVIPAPGHSAGSQLIYVQLADGAEYLFTGDISSMAANWRQLRPRSRLLSDYLAPEDRRAVIGWLRSIKALAAANPHLHVIPGHDFESIVDPRRPLGIKRYYRKGITGYGLPPNQ